MDEEADDRNALEEEKARAVGGTTVNAWPDDEMAATRPAIKKRCASFFVYIIMATLDNGDAAVFALRIRLMESLRALFIVRIDIVCERVKCQRIKGVRNCETRCKF